jgi:hypothetical protein
VHSFSNSIPATKLMAFALKKLPCFQQVAEVRYGPSCTIELTNRTLKGMRPLAKSVMNIICGPDSGISPIDAAIRIIIITFSLTQFSM